MNRNKWLHYPIRLTFRLVGTLPFTKPDPLFRLSPWKFRTETSSKKIEETFLSNSKVAPITRNSVESVREAVISFGLETKKKIKGIINTSAKLESNTLKFLIRN